MTLMDIHGKFSNTCWSCEEQHCGNTVECELKFTCKEMGIEYKEEYLKEFLTLCDKHLTAKGCWNCPLDLYCVQSFIYSKK